MSATPSVKLTWKDSIAKDGSFQRKPTSFRGSIEPDEVELGRFHLIVAYGCPWAHRTLVVRALMGLEEAVPVTVVSPLLTDAGWHFRDEDPEPFGYGFTHVRQLYEKASDGAYEGNITVPVLWDKKMETIVNNESSEIIRLLGGPLRALAKTPVDLYPEALRKQIDAINAWVYPQINNGVYRCGFARSQTAYEKAFDELFASLDRVEAMLAAEGPFLCGERLTEADVRLFTTLVRFDVAYFSLFRCNAKRIQDLPHTFAFMLRLYRLPGVADTVRFDHIKALYFQSIKELNPSGIVPKGPDLSHFFEEEKE